MNAAAEYKRWLGKTEGTAYYDELKKMEPFTQEIEESFARELSFGTAGMRGILGLGTFRMNRFTVGRATQGLADYINEVFGGGEVAISYDSRIQSEEFARETAAILAANGIKAHIYSRLMPVPLLSFATRYLNCKAGVMITASHNPAIYNGYKVYGSDGCQMTDVDADAVLARINKRDYFDFKTVDFEEARSQGKIEFIPKKVVEAYYTSVSKCRVNPYAPMKKGIRIAYTPLNGAGNEPVRRVLEMCGHKKVFVVKEQEKPDGNFPTCPYPNPETEKARNLGIKLAKLKKCDLLIATDPDSDRVGVVFKDGKPGKYRSITGNEAGVLMLDYIIRCRKQNGTLPERAVAVRSIVSSSLADEICRDNGVEMRQVLTGFKYIGEQILLLEQAGEADRFIFGFEESCGYLSSTDVRDKDGVYAAMLLAEMTSYYKSIGTTPLQVLDGIYAKYGYYRNRVANIQFPGVDGPEKMTAVMEKLRENMPSEIAGIKVAETDDILKGEHRNADGSITKINLPASNVLSFHMENGAKVIVRPSGTEPKMKLYITAKEASIAASDKLAKELEDAVKAYAGL